MPLMQEGLVFFLHDLSHRNEDILYPVAALPRLFELELNTRKASRQRGMSYPDALKDLRSSEIDRISPPRDDEPLKEGSKRMRHTAEAGEGRMGRFLSAS